MGKKTNKQEKIELDKHYKEKIEPYLKSKGVIKMWNYFLEITKTDYFQNFIREIRKKYKIPPKGIKSENGFYHFPPQGFDRNNLNSLRDEIIKNICEKYKLHYFDYSDVIEFYVYYNILQPLSELGSCGLFRVSDIIEEKEEPFSELFQKSDDMAYPIAIRISPYASQRDLIDFIKNKAIWKNEIEFLQNNYKDQNIKIGKVRKRNKEIEKRNLFIYQNRNLSRRKIMGLLMAMHKKNKRIWELDEGAISKIISLENKKRKEVNP